MPSKKKRQAAKDVARRPHAPVTYVTPMAAHLVDTLPEGAEWTYELKFDGYRALILKDGKRVELRSRKEKDLTKMYQSVAATALRVPAATAVIDGEIVALDANGRPSFQALQHRGAYPGHRIVFYAFDLLHLNGTDLMREPLTERQAKLADAIGDSGLLLSASLPGSPADILKGVKALGLEGVVAKRKSSPYVPGERSFDWQKLKLEKQQEFIVGGYRPADRSVDALIVGYYADDELRFASKVRAGFVPHTRRELFAKLARLQTKDCPFVDLPTTGGSRWGSGISAEDMQIRGTSERRGGKPSRWSGGITAEEMSTFVWVKPLVVVQIRFSEWTSEGRLRHAAFLGLRNDKSAREVRRE
jgi:bifunctional non-homologous end joining protein LigD